MVPFIVALVAVAAAGFLAGYLIALSHAREDWLPLVEAAASRPVHIMVEHTGPLTPADPPGPGKPDPLAWEQGDSDDTAAPEPRKRVPTPTFYG